MSNQPHTCIECKASLPAEAPKSRRYCGMTCRRRASRRRERRAVHETELVRLKRLLDEATAREDRLESRLAAARERIEATRTKMRRQAVKHRKRERHAQRAIIDRVHTLVATRDRLASVTADLEAAASKQSDRTDLEVAAQQIVDLQKRLATVTDRHQVLTGQYAELRDRYAVLVSDYNKAADRLKDFARDRHRFRPVIEAWDTLAGRLAKSAKTTTLSAGDREIVRMWATWQTGRDRRRRAGQ
ncbi:hypothetical protein [Brevibacterium aurantiacum]|uniref:Uncharacterized protein n=1 Tax=Brevibacterium aurantiacum TaxID=273384 RepID=A0A556CN52_BREAU|nr:hypothetical protein [Brevibacterium aurantiacum]TSI18870.1 hypothetical protein FO013_04900 [Brevibacterium aurantiacum]